jgi:hypothetical protein
MKLIGFNFTKIYIEKLKNVSKDLKIENSINIESIEEIKNEILKSKDSFLIIKFNYKLNYNPNIAKIELAGNVNLNVDEKLAKELLKDWKYKKIKEEIKIALFNSILKKVNIKSLQLEEEMNLPTHFQLPSLKQSKK